MLSYGKADQKPLLLDNGNAAGRKEEDTSSFSVREMLPLCTFKTFRGRKAYAGRGGTDLFQRAAGNHRERAFETAEQKKMACPNPEYHGLCGKHSGMRG